MTAVNKAAVANALGDLEQWAYRCHEASLHLVRSGIFGPKARVARGTAVGVGSQHSWVVLSDDVYDLEATVVDPTWWCYVGMKPMIVVDSYGAGPWTAHGDGTIGATGLPRPATGEPISLATSPGADALAWLDHYGPFDRQGWGTLFHGGMKGWPAKDIITAAKSTPDLAALIPIDILGMVTDLNPQGLYR